MLIYKNKLRRKLFKSKKLVFVFSLMILILGILTTPSIATNKVIENRVHNGKEIVGPFFSTICGVTDYFVFEETHQIHYVEWDSGNWKWTFIGIATWTDSMGNIILRGNLQMNERGEGDYPALFTTEHNTVEKCSGTSATPGLSYNFHIGITVGNDGTLRQFHIHE
jgi:hypothetical protein